MVESSEYTERLGSLFETITGRSVLTERQRSSHSTRISEHGDDAIATYVVAMTRNDGLADAVQEPERN